MAIFFDAPVSPDDLTVFVRQVPLPSTNALSALFPRQDVDDNTIDFATIIQTNRMAKYRSFDGRIHVSERDTGSESRVRLLPLSTSLGLGEYERLQMQFARTGGTFTSALENSVYNDAQNLTNEVLNRIEYAWGDVLSDGKLTISEGGYAGEADFGVPANQIVAPATLWSSPSATPLTNMLAWADVYNNTNGFLPGQILTSLATLRSLQTNTEMLNAAYGATVARTRVTLPDLNNVLTSVGLPEITSTYNTKKVMDGSTVNVLAPSKVVFLPPNIDDLGYTAYGVSATALELTRAAESDLSFSEAPGIVGVVIKEGPPFRQYTFVDATAMPIIKNANLLMTATVA